MAHGIFGIPGMPDALAGGAWQERLNGEALAQVASKHWVLGSEFMKIRASRKRAAGLRE